MARREISETGYYHITTRSAGQVALFEDDSDRRRFLSLLKEARDKTGARVIAWVLMTDHVHLVVDFGNEPSLISDFMYLIDSRYSRYFNAKTGRSGTLFQGEFWSKPIRDESQLIATVHYVHMNPEAAGLAPMRSYRWSSYREYAGTLWVVDTSTVLKLFGGFQAFDAYVGSPKDVVRRRRATTGVVQDGDALALALGLADVSTSDELRRLPVKKRNVLIKELLARGVGVRKVARTLGIGAATVTRAAHR